MAAGGELYPHVHITVAAPVKVKRGFKQAANHLVCGLGGVRSEEEGGYATGRVGCELALGVGL